MTFRKLLRIRPKIPHDECQYLHLIRKTLATGDIIEGRNGKTKSTFGYTMRFSLKDNTIPLLTTKKLAWKTCLKELFWFMNGSTNNDLLKQQNVTIWNKNASRQFLDSRDLMSNRAGDLGPIYGHQWRHFNAAYKDCETDYTGKGVDQLATLVQNLKNADTKYSRRHIISAWNPVQLPEMALPPCHLLAQFHVNQEDELSCCLFQRSGDIGLGIPFNIASYSFLTHILAKHCDLKPLEFVHFIGNAHIYEKHEGSLEKQMKNTPQPFPTITIKNKKENIDDYEIHDISIKDYTYVTKIKMDMIE